MKWRGMEMSTPIKQPVDLPFLITDGNVDSPKGFYATGTASGIKKNGRLDLGLIYSEVPATSAAVYTLNTFIAAPLLVTKEALAKSNNTLSAIVVNSGNANACTGDEGLNDARMMQAAAADLVGVPREQVAVASTGVIGVRLPMDKVYAGIEKLKDTPKDASLFSQAILTTDTVEKRVSVQVDIDGKTVTIAGCAKGSGMIHPNMATMLSFVTTDAKIENDYLQQLLKTTTDETYNMITVDGDTSTNDMVVVMANGMAGNEPLSEQHIDAPRFAQAFLYVQKELAKKIARDGEGATKLIEVTVRNADSAKKARRIAKTIIGSNLVKTAVFGADANWGRIVCALGYSQTTFAPDRVDIYLGSIQVVSNGMPKAFNEEEATAYLKQEQVQIIVDLNEGCHDATAWGCDLTYDYVKINASYRT
jgi:glutamate N-acetyltransferase/amino-acid N-acetyltransferase